MTTGLAANTTEATPAPYYERGGVRIFHGEAFEVLDSLHGLQAIVTDPPYSSGGAFRGDRAQSTVTKYVHTGTAAYRPEFGGDNRDQRAFEWWCYLWLVAAYRATVPGATLCSFIDWRQLPTLTDAIQAGGWTWRGVAPWNKKSGRPCANRFSAACEFLLWGSHGPHSTKRTEHSVYPAGIVECAPPSNKQKQHIAQKPIPVMEWALSIVPRGGTVCDPFLGSGSTLVAAVNLGIPAIGIEAEEVYCQMAAERLDAVFDQQENAAA